MKRLLSTILIASLLIGVTTTTSAVSAQEQIYVSDAIEAAAPYIVNGTVITRENVVLDGQPFQVSTFQITDSLKGDLEGMILVETPGGELGDGAEAWVSHAAHLLPNRVMQLALGEPVGTVGNSLAVSVDPTLEVYSVFGGEEGAYEVVPAGVFRGYALMSGTDYLLNGFAWEDFDVPVQFWVNPANSPLGTSTSINAVKRGFQLLEDDPGSAVDFEYAGTTTKSGFNLGDNQIVVSWVEFVPGVRVAGETQAAIGPDGYLADFDIRLNQDAPFTSGAVFDRLDLGAVVGHEAGHGVGLTHTALPSEGMPDINPIPTSENLMFHTLPFNHVKPLGPADRAGLAELYPFLGEYCAGQLVTVNLNLGQSPTSGDDVILGTPGDDNIDGRAGNDTICAGAGYDVVHGGHGDDYIEGGHQGDYLYGDQGNDRILGESGNDRLFGDGDDDDLFGNSGNDKLYGGNGRDLLRGGDGRDSMYGNNDNDKLYGGDGDDRLFGESGNDRLWGDAGADKLNGSNGDDELYGGDDADVISGSKGDDLLDGGPGNDTLDGGSHQDECDGASGVDTAERCEITTST